MPPPFRVTHVSNQIWPSFYDQLAALVEGCQLFTNKYSVMDTVEYVVLFEVVDALHCVITDNSICCLYMLIMAMIPLRSVLLFMNFKTLWLCLVEDSFLGGGVSLQQTAVAYFKIVGLSHTGSEVMTLVVEAQSHQVYILTFNRGMAQYCPIQCTYNLLSEREKVVP